VICLSRFEQKEIMKVEIEKEELETMKARLDLFDKIDEAVTEAYTNDDGDLCSIGEEVCRILGWLW